MNSRFWWNANAVNSRRRSRNNVCLTGHRRFAYVLRAAVLRAVADGCVWVASSEVLAQPLTAEAGKSAVLDARFSAAGIRFCHAGSGRAFLCVARTPLHS